MPRCMPFENKRRFLIPSPNDKFAPREEETRGIEHGVRTDKYTDESQNNGKFGARTQHAPVAPLGWWLVWGMSCGGVQVSRLLEQFKGREGELVYKLYQKYPQVVEIISRNGQDQRTGQSFMGGDGGKSGGEL